ncbi:MAG: gliding motility-associated-like protein [Arenicella sp.]|jgi:gliding motility-associated-like protein
MYKLLSLLVVICSTSLVTAQTPNNCDDYTTTGPSSSSFNPSPDVACTGNVPGLVNGTAAWSGTSCSGTLISTSTTGAVTCMTLAYTAVNTNDFAVITTDGGGVLTITGINVGVAGTTIGPYNCGTAPYGDVSITVCSTIPFTVVTLTNTGCSSGWVINCGGCSGNLPAAGADDLTTTLCGGTIDLNSLVTGDPGGTWEETTSSGQFTPGTGIFDANGLTAATYNFLYIHTDGCGAFDTAYFNVTVGGSGSAGVDGNSAICNTPGSTIDLDNLLVGADPGGNWEETTSSGQFTAGSGLFDGSGLGTGVYNFLYIVPAIAPCLEDTSEFAITVAPPPGADFEWEINSATSANGDLGGCMTFPVNMTDFSTIALPGTIDSYSWDFGDAQFSSDQNPTHQYGAGGNYIIELTVTSNGGCTSTFSLPIEILQSPDMAINFNTPTCYLFTDGSIVVNTTGGSGTEVFTITDSLGNTLNTGNSNAANNLGEGWYYLNVDAGSGCAQIDSVFIDDPDEMTIDLELTNPACYGIPTGTAEVGFVYNAGGDLNNISYFWSPNPGGQSGVGADSTGSMNEGPYTVTVNDDNGCSEVFDFFVQYPPELIFNDIGSDPAYCRQFGYQSGNGVVFASAAGGTPDYNYQWENLGTGATSINTTWGGLNPGSYEMTVFDNNGCVLTQVVELDSLNPISDFEATSLQFTGPAPYEGTAPVDVVFTNNSLNFANPNNPNADTTFFWNFNHDITSPGLGWQISHDPTEVFDTTYTGERIYEVCLVTINKNGCTDTLCKDLIIHELPKLITPNVFTPGIDNANDEFTFEFRSQAVSEFKGEIFDRWGKRMFIFTDITDAWDGTTLGGNEATDGVYFYTYEAVFTNGETQAGQGTVQLIREK